MDFRVLIKRLGDFKLKFNQQYSGASQRLHETGNTIGKYEIHYWNECTNGEPNPTQPNPKKPLVPPKYPIPSLARTDHGRCCGLDVVVNTCSGNQPDQLRGGLLSSSPLDFL